MKKYVIGMMLALIITVNVFSQQSGNAKMPKGKGSIKGIISDSNTGALLPYSTVVLLSGNNDSVLDGVVTKENGDFSFSEIPDGLYKIKCSFMGYESHVSDTFLINESLQSKMFGMIPLKQKNIETEAVVVSADKDAVVFKLDKKIINISDNPNAQGGRLSEALQNIPSVSVDMEGNVSIRGSQNFQVLIDGKPTLIPGNDILRQIPANAVENIELITNPSAKYDPEGTAGIVNIVLKKASLNGLNGNVNCNVGNHDRYSADGLFNYRYEDINFYFGTNWHEHNNISESMLTRETYSLNRDTTNFIDPYVDRRMKDKGISGRAGIEYSLTKQDFASLSTNINYNDFNRYFPSKMREWSNPFSEYQYFVNNDDYTVKGSYSTINTYYQHNFSDAEHKITANVNNVIWDGGGDEISDKYSTDNNFNIYKESRQSHRGTADSRTFMNKSQIDYSLPISEKYSFETGYCFDYVQDFSDYLYRDFDLQTNNWLTNNNYTNNTKFFHTINAIYTTFGGSIFDINYQLGLRAEYYNRRLYQETNDISYLYEKMNYFPSVHISKAFDPTMQAQFSYSRRVQRPDVYVLNPFPDYADDYVVSIGNPNLMPEFTDSYELNFSKSYEFLFLSLESYYRYTDNAISRIMKMSENKLLISSENVGTNSVYGLEISANFNLYKKLRLNLSANMYNYEIASKDQSFQSNVKGDVFDGTIQLSYSIAGNSLVQISSIYNGPKYFTDGRIESTYGVGFAVRQFFFDKKLTVFLTGRNILSTYEFRHTNERPDYKSYGYTKPMGGIVSLGLSLNINNFENKVRPEDKIERTNVGSSGGY